MSRPDRRQALVPLRSLRGRVVFVFASSASLVALVLVASVFMIGRDYMESQRVRTVERGAEAHAEMLRALLDDPGANAATALRALNPPANTVVLLRWDSEWASSHPDFDSDPAVVLPQGRGRLGPGPTERVTLGGRSYLRTGVVLSEEGGVLYEFAPLTELEATLRMLRNVLIVCGLVAVAIGAALGVWASHHALKPLRQVARTAARIAAGEHEIRLPSSRDRDLSTTVDAFNAMVDALQRRIERERRLVSDIGHELRTPLTTLTTGVAVMNRHTEELPERPRQALGLVNAELDHLRRLLEDLLALARAEAGIHRSDLEPLSLGELLSNTLAARNYDTALLHVESDVVVEGRKIELERAVANLLENADRHGDGVVGVRVGREGQHAVLAVDDAGPGVPEPDRERIFERFATVRTSRRSTAGTGIGLALVAETVAAHRGAIACVERPGGGARFVVVLPAVAGSS
ncbi:Signal transduction histidine kinase [Nocardia amikacinitolerans]|uniref:sensor histidine kinase n=1 Tax=Nocardia amikacinitolerans TaxID=756689 RepID=UPI0008370C08|nr:HAMP domain-containing sensor histidine kinase [Nocardia amikacinitolerans]MCP2315082.1 Signal transduction histidine kinase [Nocardia amikacinitolerans]